MLYEENEILDDDQDQKEAELTIHEEVASGPTDEQTATAPTDD